VDGRVKPGHDDGGSEAQPQKRSANSYRYKSQSVGRTSEDTRPAPTAAPVAAEKSSTHLADMDEPPKVIQFCTRLLHTRGR
jgi:hypothetical protein